MPYSSEYDANIHFTPIWFPDSNYSVVCYTSDYWTPGGMLSAKIDSNVIKIVGSMYDDFYPSNNVKKNNCVHSNICKINVVKHTKEQYGYSGDDYCSDCAETQKSRVVSVFICLLDINGPLCLRFEAGNFTVFLVANTVLSDDFKTLPIFKMYNK